VPLTYPKLKRKFGPEVTYEDNPAAHLKTEFAFDVIQTARGAYTPDAYRDFIGFEVAESLLERAFVETYSLVRPRTHRDARHIDHENRASEVIAHPLPNPA
jgi:hypothetical protein